MDFQNLTTEQKRNLMMALKACVYGTITNQRCEYATYTCDIKKKHGGPYYIHFDTAAEMVMDLAESLEDAETRSAKEKQDGQKESSQD